MTIQTVGPTSTYTSIGEALTLSLASDTINLEAGYSNEDAVIGLNNITLFGEATSTEINLQLLEGVTTFTMTGEADFDVIDSADANAIVGNAGDNRIRVSGGADSVNGGLGDDRLIVNYHAASGAITGDSTSNFSEAGSGGSSVTLTGGTIEHFTILTGTGADTITTGAGNDTIRTGSGASTVSVGQGANSVFGGNNADTITALDGGNYIDAGNGTNNVTTGGGIDTVLSGNGSDTIVTGSGIDTITLLGGADTVDAGAGKDRLIIDYSNFTTSVTGGIATQKTGSGYVGHFEDIQGNRVDFKRSEAFTITTSDASDTLKTGAGSDVIHAGGNNDRLITGNGKDVLFGDAGGDFLASGLGADQLTGGTGEDTFVFKSALQIGLDRDRDVITDFKVDADTLNLASIDANRSQNGNQEFDFIGNDAFSSSAGELRMKNGILSGDIDGDGKADFELEFTNNAQLTNTDFLL